MKHVIYINEAKFEADEDTIDMVIHAIKSQGFIYDDITQGYIEPDLYKDTRSIPEMIRDGDAEWSSGALLRNGVEASGDTLFAADRIAAAERIDNLEAENEILRAELQKYGEWMMECPPLSDEIKELLGKYGS